MLGEILIAGIASLLLCMFLGPKFIGYLREKEFGQQIREEGPAGHQGKAGTPTMGGLIMALAVAIPYLILGKLDAQSLAVFGTMLASGLLGFIDDWTKVSHRRSLGVSGKRKLLVQLVISVGLWIVATQAAHLHSQLNFRMWGANLDLGPAYPVLIFLVLAGATNGVNLTDGLDGLAAGCSAIVLLAYTAMTLSSGQSDLALIIGGIFVIEALSVLIQVFSFQRFRKRVFLMAPVHHHFELMAWSETKIILRFWIVAAALAAIGFTIYRHSVSL